MTPRQRLLAALWLEEPDRIPLDMFLGFNPLYGEDWPTDPRLRKLGELVRRGGDPLISGGFGEARNFFYTASPVKVAAERRVEAGMEVTTTVVETPKGPLTEVSRRPVGIAWSGRRSRAFVESEEELERFLSIPYRPVEPDVSPFHRLAEKVGERGLVHSGVAEPIRLVWSLMDQRALTLRYFRDRGSILALEDLFFERICDYLEYVLRRGVRFFLVGGPEFVTPPLFGPRQFREMVVKYETGMANLIHEYDGLAWVHCHGSVNHVLDQFVSTRMDGLHPIDTPPIGDTPLKEAKRKLSGKMCIIGGIQVGGIYQDPKEAIAQKVREAIYACGPDGLILLPSAPPYTPIPDNAMANYETILETVKIYGSLKPSGCR